MSDLKKLETKLKSEACIFTTVFFILGYIGAKLEFTIWLPIGVSSIILTCFIILRLRLEAGK